MTVMLLLFPLSITVLDVAMLSVILPQKFEAVPLSVNLFVVKHFEVQLGFSFEY